MTNYHTRTIDTFFNYPLDNYVLQTSSNQELNVPANYIRILSTTILSNKRWIPRSNTGKTLVNYLVTTEGDTFIDFLNIFRPITYKTTWSGHGFTISNLTTFKQELCTAFESIKVSLGLTDDDGNINLYLHVIRIKDTEFIYFMPIFYQGNDPNADEIISV